MLKSQYFLFLGLALVLTSCGKSISKSAENTPGGQSGLLADTRNPCDIAKARASGEIDTFRQAAQDSVSRGSQLINEYFASLAPVDTAKGKDAELTKRVKFSDRRRGLMACYGDELKDKTLNLEHRDIRAEMDRNRTDYLEANYKTVAEAFIPSFAGMKSLDASTTSFNYTNASADFLVKNPGKIDLRTDLALTGDFLIPNAEGASDVMTSAGAFNVTYLALDSASQEPTISAEYTESSPAPITYSETIYTIEASAEKAVQVISQKNKHGETEGVFQVTREIDSNVKFYLKNSETGLNDFRFGFDDDAEETARYVGMMIPKECQTVTKTNPAPSWR